MDTRRRIVRVAAVTAAIAAASIISGIGLLLVAIELEFDDDIFGPHFAAAVRKPVMW